MPGSTPLTLALDRLARRLAELDAYDTACGILYRTPDFEFCTQVEIMPPLVAAGVPRKSSGSIDAVTVPWFDVSFEYHGGNVTFGLGRFPEEFDVRVSMLVKRSMYSVDSRFILRPIDDCHADPLTSGVSAAIFHWSLLGGFVR